MDISKMSIEELREYALELQNKVSDFNSQTEGFNNKITEKDKQIETLNNDIQSLKAKNFDLFMKVSNQVDVPHETQKPQEPTKSLDDITNLMIGDE